MPNISGSAKSFCSGGLPDVTEDQLSRSKMAATKAVNSLKSRHSSNFAARVLASSIANPDEEDESEDDSGELELWRLLPQLKDLPEAWLKKLPLSAMFQLNTALAKENKVAEKLGVNSRLAKNSKKIAKHPSIVERGPDNRKDVLHPARFLGGASCALSEQWAAARKVIGDEGVLPLGNYDLEAIGCGGCVTPKGWAELHNPASQELKLKWFHLPNVGGGSSSGKRGDGEDVGGENLKEIADLDSFKVALNTAREALTSALPWNRSISAIVGLMVNTGYLQEDLGGNSKRAAILTEFVDYVFNRNALNWENHQSFLSTDELSHVWANWKGKRGVSSSGSKSSEKQKKEKESDKKKSSADICKFWNAKVCKQQKEKECKTPFGKVLRHVCNKYLAGGKVCQKDHCRVDHV